MITRKTRKTPEGRETALPNPGVEWRGFALFVSFALFVFLPSAALADSAASKNNRGNKLYHEKKYGEALRHYRDAQLENPRSPQIHFNAGDALFQAQEFDQATEAYSKALSLGIPDKNLEAQTHYNLGNCFYKKDRFAEAVASYRRALSMKPEDRDFKFNLELAQEKLRTQQQAQNQQGQQNQKKQDQDKQNEKGQQDDPRQGQRDRQNQQDQQKQEEGQSPPRPGELSKQEAERVLDAVKDQEREAQTQRRVAVTGRRSTGEER
jgi:tetratricopeptide (TPR) repeat protein